MKKIQVMLDEKLLAALDEVVAREGTNRSAFIRAALARSLRQQRLSQLEAQQRLGYEQQPASSAEIMEWASEQAWGDDS